MNQIKKVHSIRCPAFIYEICPYLGQVSRRKNNQKDKARQAGEVTNDTVNEIHRYYSFQKKNKMRHEITKSK